VSPDLYGRVQEGVRKYCAGMIVQFSTGGHCRTGLEDNLRATRERLASCNADLVKKIVDDCPRFDRRSSTPAEARPILSLAPTAPI